MASTFDGLSAIGTFGVGFMVGTVEGCVMTSVVYPLVSKFIPTNPQLMIKPHYYVLPSWLILNALWFRFKK